MGGEKSMDSPRESGAGQSILARRREGLERRAGRLALRGLPPLALDHLPQVGEDGRAFGRRQARPGAANTVWAL